MTDQKNDLSPWVHPKSQAWFKALFRRTNLLIALEDELKKPDDQLTIQTVRMILAFAVMLGKPEIWPDSDRDVLKYIANRSRQFARLPPQSLTGKPVTVSEHQAHNKLVDQINIEVEILRRRLGTSVRKSKIKTPPSWEPFWE